MHGYHLLYPDEIAYTEWCKGPGGKVMGWNGVDAGGDIQCEFYWAGGVRICEMWIGEDRVVQGQ